MSNVISNFKRTINDIKGATRNVAEKLPLLSLKPDNSYEAAIGRPVMSPQGGTEIVGNIDSRINPDLPNEMSSGKVDLFVHEGGLRIRKQLGATFLLPIESIREVSQQGQSVTKRAGALLELAGKAIDGGISGGAVGAGLAAGKSVLTGELGQEVNKVSFYVRIIYQDGQRDRAILIETSESASNQFVDRVKERFAA
jgi:hypothetical protein